MDVLNIIELGKWFGLPGLILGAWIWDSTRKERILKEAYDRYYDLLTKVVEALAKMRVILQERLPGRGNSEE